MSCAKRTLPPRPACWRRLPLLNRLRATQLSRYSSSDLRDVRALGSLRLGEALDDLTLPPGADLAIAVEGCQNSLVPEILAPCFELLRRLADFLAAVDQRAS